MNEYASNFVLLKKKEVMTLKKKLILAKKVTFKTGK